MNMNTNMNRRRLFIFLSFIGFPIVFLWLFSPSQLFAPSYLIPTRLLIPKANKYLKGKREREICTITHSKISKLAFLFLYIIYSYKESCYCCSLFF